MIKVQFQDKQLPMLGFGTMRLPTLENGKIDETRVSEMVAYAMENGVNYFDTAYPYHNSESEIVIGKVLKNYPRESFYLADKYPGHQTAETYDPAAIFEEQLKKCGVDYFDFYLLHNVNENSIKTYMDERWGILEYFLEQKKLGRIKHLGFSSHGALGNMREFLGYCGEHMEFCQIQLNYLDWTLQNAKVKCQLLAEYNIPVWVMEPVRGGKLANLSDDDANKLKALRPDESVAAWCFRFLQNIPNVAVVLSGMSNMEQMIDNVKTYSELKPLNETELNMVLDIAEGMKDSIPCTACGYCLEGCPMGINIPDMIGMYNELRLASSIMIPMRIEALPEDKRPGACIGCGACTAICPQNLEISTHLADFASALAKMPSWAEISRQRAEAAKKAKENK